MKEISKIFLIIFVLSLAFFGPILFLVGIFLTQEPSPPQMCLNNKFYERQSDFWVDTGKACFKGDKE